LGSERLTAAQLDRIAHFDMSEVKNGDRYRLAQGRARKAG